MSDLRSRQGVLIFFERHLLVVISCVFLVFASSCSKIHHETKPLETEDQGKSQAQLSSKKQQLLKELQQEEDIKQDLVFETYPNNFSVSYSLLDAPEVAYKIAVLLPFSSDIYGNFANDIFKAITLALIQKVSLYKKYTLYPIDTGSTKEEFTKALSNLEEINPQVAIGPLLTQNVLSLISKSYLYNFHFLVLNANPVFTLRESPPNIWFMDSSPIHELQLLQQEAEKHTSLVILLPPGVKVNPLDSIFKSSTTLPLHVQDSLDTTSPTPSQMLYLPLKFKENDIFSLLNRSRNFFGFSWINSLPNLSQKNDKEKIFRIIPKKMISNQLTEDFHTYLNHAPSAIELISYAAFQIAVQLLDEIGQSESTLAYRSIIGTVYIGENNFAHYDMTLEEL